MAPVRVLINMLWPLAFVTQGLAVTVRARVMTKGTLELIQMRTVSENAPATSEAELTEVNSHDQAPEVKGSSLEPDSRSGGECLGTDQIGREEGSVGQESLVR